ncbi:MAG TPA: hypothetical protein VMN56_04385, partial [Casimicrobiaceae bacterium]|nr:hypothetical protein [Casimicrobiaceae bacterium]
MQRVAAVARDARGHRRHPHHGGGPPGMAQRCQMRLERAPFRAAELSFANPAALDKARDRACSIVDVKHGDAADRVARHEMHGP